MSIRGDTEAYDASELSLFKSCPYKYWASAERRLRRATSKKVAAEFGQALHLGIPILLRNGSGGLEEAIREAEAYFAPHEDPTDDMRTVGKLGTLLEAYTENYDLEAFEVMDVEIPFMLPFPGFTDVFYAGKMDMRVRDKKSDLRLIWDIKSTFNIGGFCVMNSLGLATGSLSTLSGFTRRNHYVVCEETGYLARPPQIRCADSLRQEHLAKLSDGL
jgi:hypothetical protein